MKLLGLSGGSTKGVGILGVVEGMYSNGYTPDIIVGTSIGAILAVPIAVGKVDSAVMDKIRNKFLNITLNDIFDTPPVDTDGKWKISALVGLIFNKIAVSSIEVKVKKLIKEIITPSIFNTYSVLASQGRMAKCFVVYIDFFTGDSITIPVHTLSYEEYLDYTVASACIPIFNTPIKKNNTWLFDGGLRDHIGTHKIIEMGYPIEEAISVFSRGRDKKPTIKGVPTNILGVLEQTINIMNNEISKLDEFMIDKYCEEKKIINKKVYLPQILTSLYDVKKERLKQLYDIGYYTGKEIKIS